MSSCAAFDANVFMLISLAESAEKSIAYRNKENGISLNTIGLGGMGQAMMSPAEELFDGSFGSVGVALEVNPSHDELVAFFEIRTFKLVFEDRVFGKELAC